MSVHSRGIATVALFFACVLSTGATASPTKKIAVLVFEGVQVIDFSGPVEVFADAGYDVFTVAATRAPIHTAAGNGLQITPRYTFANAPEADLVVVPGGNFEAAPGSPTANWIRRASGRAAHTLSVCNGAFSLANAGLLDGLRATTTHGHLARLQRTFPKLTVVDDQRVVDNGRILTAAGLSAGIDGALHMVEVFDGRDAARRIATFIEYDWRP